MAVQVTLAFVPLQVGPSSSLQASTERLPQLPVDTDSSVSKLVLALHVLAVIVPQIPVTVHQTFLYGPSHVLVGLSFVAAALLMIPLEYGSEAMVIALAQASFAGITFTVTVTQVVVLHVPL